MTKRHCLGFHKWIDFEKVEGTCVLRRECRRCGKVATKEGVHKWKKWVSFYVGGNTKSRVVSQERTCETCGIVESRDAR